MHLSKVIIDGTHKATLRACTSSQRPGYLVVHVLFPSTKNRMIHVAEMFTTDCLAADWCGPTLLSKFIGPIEGIANWDVPLDLDPSGKLIPFDVT